MKNLQSIFRFILVLFMLISCETANEFTEETVLAEEVIEDVIDESTETTFDENEIYVLSEDTWLTIGVAKAPARARVILEVYFEDGTIEKWESNPNNYLFISYKIDQDAVKARLKVIDQDDLSGIKFSVISKSYDRNREYEYFRINEKDVRYFSKTIFFKEE